MFEVTKTKRRERNNSLWPEKLNIMADKIIGKNASNPKSIHIRNTNPTTSERKYVLTMEPKTQLGSSRENIDGHNRH